MKILADTSVWSLALRRRKTAQLSSTEERLTRLLAEAIGDGRITMIGPIRQELLSGIRERGQFDKLRGALHPFPDEPIATVDYEEAARLYNLCRARGVECGPVDILICAVAMRRAWKVLANDTGLANCMAVVDAQPESKGIRL